MIYRRAALAGALVAWAVMAFSLGAGGCRKPKRAMRWADPAPEEMESSPVQAEVVRFTTELDGTIGAYMKLRNAGTKKLLSAQVVCTAKDVTGQAVGSTKGMPVPARGLAPGESVDFHWFIPVSLAGGVSTVTAQAEQVKTE